MATTSQWFLALILSISSGLLAGCGTTQPALDRTVLNDELSIHLSKGQLTADMMRINGSVMISNPLTLRAALQNPVTHFGILVGPAASWTLVFGVEPQKPGERIFVNGHRTVQHSTPASVTPGYIVWHCFLSGNVGHPVVKIRHES